MKRLLVLTTAVVTLSRSRRPLWRATYHMTRVRRRAGTARGSATVTNGYVTAYTACPGEGIVTRMSGGSERAPNFSGAHQQFTAPPGTRIVHFSGDLRFHAENGWYIGFIDDSFAGSGAAKLHELRPILANRHPGQHLLAPGTRCLLPATAALASIRTASSSCATSSSRSRTTHAAGAITGGSVGAAGKEVIRTCSSASDSSGISSSTLVMKPLLVPHRSCDWALARPRHATILRRIFQRRSFESDGPSLSPRQSTPVATGPASREILDRPDPARQALDARDGGDGWRAHNRFAIGWRNPSQIGFADRSCAVRPVSCSERRRRHPQLFGGQRPWGRVPGTAGSKPGEWRLSVWLEDEAGNADHERAVSVGVLRFDDDAGARGSPHRTDPTGCGSERRDSRASRGQVEARREGGTRRSLPRRGGHRFSATIDDERLPRGRYELRPAPSIAPATSGPPRQPNGTPAARTLPLRVATRLAVGPEASVSVRATPVEVAVPERSSA